MLMFVMPGKTHSQAAPQLNGPFHPVGFEI
jgi:hypothetical protein